MASRQVSSRAPRAGSADDVADRLHSAAIHLLRRLRREDDASGLSAPRLSALSVLVFGGPLTIGALAAAEQVRVAATSAATALLHAGRRRRVAALSADVGKLSAKDRRAVLVAIPVLERL